MKTLRLLLGSMVMVGLVTAGALALGRTTRLVSVGAGADSIRPSMSADGRYVAFLSVSPPERYRIYLRDMWTSTTTKINQPPFVCVPSISANGRFVTFYGAGNDRVLGVYRYDRLSPSPSIRLPVPSTTVWSDPQFGPPSVSDGGLVAHVTLEAPLEGPPSQIHVTPPGCIVSRNSTGAEANDDCWAPVISADGKYLAFASRATNLLPLTIGVYHSHVYLAYAACGPTFLQVDAGADRGSDLPSINGNGTCIAFESDATTYPHNPNSGRDVYVRCGAAIYWASSFPPPMNADIVASYHASIDCTGTHVAFTTERWRLSPGPVPGTGNLSPIKDIFLWPEMELISMNSSGEPANAPSDYPSTSQMGECVAFQSTATNLLPVPMTQAWSRIYARCRK